MSWRGWGHIPCRAAWLRADGPGNDRPFRAPISAPSCGVTNSLRAPSLSHRGQMSIWLGLSWILLPCPVYGPPRAHNGPLLVWHQVGDVYPWRVHMLACQDLVGLALLLLLTPSLPWRLDVSGKRKVSELVLKNRNLIMALPFMISEPLCPYL